jgi:hypothetical protein
MGNEEEKMKNYVRLVIALALLLVLSGCLTTEFKEYRFTINSDGSGSGKITYVNIVSEEDEGENVSFKDFGELMSDYIEGQQFETDNPRYNVTRKELIEVDGKLNGVIEFTFANADSIGFWRYNTSSPWLYYMGSLSETLKETDGKYLGNDRDFPIICWEPGSRSFYFKTVVKEDMTNAHALLPLYKTWQQTQ